jgi:hypothetical protein
MRYLYVCCLFNDAIANLEARADGPISHRMGRQIKKRREENGKKYLRSVL